MDKFESCLESAPGKEKSVEELKTVIQKLTNLLRQETMIKEDLQGLLMRERNECKVAKAEASAYFSVIENFIDKLT